MHGNLISLSQLIIKLRRRLQDFSDDPRRIIPKGVTKIGKSIFGVKPFLEEISRRHEGIKEEVEKIIVHFLSGRWEILR